MIIPNYSITYDGDVKFEITHLSEGKEESKKQVLERATYKTWITVDQEKHEIIEFECECRDFKMRRKSMTQCKHLKQSIKLLQATVPDLRDLEENPERKSYTVQPFEDIGIKSMHTDATTRIQ